MLRAPAGRRLGSRAMAEKRAWSASTTSCSRSATSTRRSTSTADLRVRAARPRRAMAFLDMGDQFLVLAEGRTRSRMARATSGSWSTTASASASCRGGRRRAARRARARLPRSLGQPRPGRRSTRTSSSRRRRPSWPGWASSSRSRPRRSRSCARRASASRARASAAACSRVGATIGQDWSIALGLPGKFTISVRPRTPGDAAGEQAQRRVVARVGSDRLRVAGRLAVDHVARGLRRHVVHGEARAAGGEHEAHPLLVGQPLQHAGDRLAVVRHGLVRDVQPGRLAQLGQPRPRHVLALAARQRARHREHRRPHRRQSWRPPDFSSSTTSRSRLRAPGP